MQNNVDSNISWYEGHTCTITSLGKILKFSKFYVQNIWQVVRWWHHQLTHLHIHIDWSRNVLWKFAKLQSVITSLFFNRFSSGFHCYVWTFLLFSLKFKLNLFRISPLTFVCVCLCFYNVCGACVCVDARNLRAWLQSFWFPPHYFERIYIYTTGSTCHIRMSNK